MSDTSPRKTAEMQALKVSKIATGSGKASKATQIFLALSRANLVCRGIVAGGGEDVAGGVGEWVGRCVGGRRW